MWKNSKLQYFGPLAFDKFQIKDFPLTFFPHVFINFEIFHNNLMKNVTLP